MQGQVLDVPAFDVVVVSRGIEAKSWNQGVLTALVLGLPVVSQFWLTACQQQQTAVNIDQYLLMAQRKPWRGFTGLAVYIHGAALQQRICTLLRLSGKAFLGSRKLLCCRLCVKCINCAQALKVSGHAFVKIEN